MQCCNMGLLAPPISEDHNHIEHIKICYYLIQYTLEEKGIWPSQVFFPRCRSAPILVQESNILHRHL